MSVCAQEGKRRQTKGTFRHIPPKVSTPSHVLLTSVRIGCVLHIPSKVRTRSPRAVDLCEDRMCSSRRGSCCQKGKKWKPRQWRETLRPSPDFWLTVDCWLWVRDVLRKQKYFDRRFWPFLRITFWSKGKNLDSGGLLQRWCSQDSSFWIDFQ